METRINLKTFVLNPLALETTTTSDLFVNLEKLEYGENVILDAKKCLVDLLTGANGDKRFPEQHSEIYVLEGIEKMFEIMHSNAPITAAPRDEKERKIFYIKLAKGFKFLGDIIHEEFIRKKLDKKDVYSCLETIGDGGHSCAGRWRQVLEEVLVGFSHKIKNTQIIDKVELDPLNTEIESLFYRARVIEGNKAAEEFVKENYPGVHESSRIHYITFFKRYLNDFKNYHLPTTMDQDSYLGIEEKDIKKNVEKYLMKSYLDHGVVKRFITLFTDKIRKDNALFQMVVNESKKIFYVTDLKGQYEDIGDFLARKIFKGYTKDICQDAMLDLIVRKGFISLGERTVDISSTVEKFLNTNQLDELQELFEKLSKDATFPKQKLKYFMNMRSHKGHGELLFILATKNTDHPLWLYLLENGVNYNSQNKYGNTALHVSAYRGKIDVVERLLEKGAKVELQNKSGSTPLHFAALKGEKEITTILLEKGSSLDAKDNEGNTPLHLSILKDHLDVTQKLLEKGADVNAKNDSGITPLHRAVKTGNSNLVHLLIQYQANLTLESKDGDTPLQIARKNQQNQIAKILTMAEAKNVELKMKKQKTSSLKPITKTKEMVLSV
jgi:ankyrin repeat protein